MNVNSGRLKTGIEGLDTLLNGGFVRGGVYLLLGPPGSGKTIVGNQICFNHAREEAGSVVYVTLLAESHSRMMGNLRTLDYFSDEMVARSVHYLSGYRALESGGLKGLLALIAGIVREKKATLLMIDGITTIGDMEQSALAFRKFTHELNTYIAASGCTAFLLSSMEGHHSKPEHTMVDGIVALHQVSAGLRTLREVEVRKFRGSDHLKGRHYFSITEHGATVYPRIESLKPEKHLPWQPNGLRQGFGIPGLDQMLGGGIVPNSVTTMIGASGTGKTILGLHFVHAGAAAGEKSLIFGFYERSEDLLEKASNMGLDLKAQVKSGIVELVWFPALEQQLDELGDVLLRAVRRSGAQRVFIDGVDGFRYSSADPKRINRFFVALIMKLKALGTTVLVVEETTLFSVHRQRQVAELSALNENLLLLRHIDSGTELLRVISVLKARNSHYDPRVRELRLTVKGAAVLGVIQSSEGILTGYSRGLDLPTTTARQVPRPARAPSKTKSKRPSKAGKRRI